MRVAYFCNFHNEHGDTVFINPLKVRYFTAAPMGHDLTRIFFDAGHSIIVKASPVEVENGLTVAHRSEDF
jgi:hypothetical protein